MGSRNDCLSNLFLNLHLCIFVLRFGEKKFFLNGNSTFLPLSPEEMKFWKEQTQSFYQKLAWNSQKRLVLAQLKEDITTAILNVLNESNQTVTDCTQALTDSDALLINTDKILQITERKIRDITKEIDWQKQIEAWNKLLQ